MAKKPTDSENAQRIVRAVHAARGDRRRRSGRGCVQWATALHMMMEALELQMPAETGSLIVLPPEKKAA